MLQNNDSSQPTGQTVIAEVADALASSAPNVRARLVSVRTERELAKRVEILDKALEVRHKLFIETKKHKLKMLNVVGEDGTVTKVPAPMTDEELKAHQKAVKEANEKLAQFDENLAKAFDKADADAFDKLEKACKG